MRYRLRFFFDPGSGVCLWSANDAARERFDYPIELVELPLSDETRQSGEELIGRFDTSLDWSDPGGPSPWTASDAAAFDESALSWLALARHELGEEYDIVNQLSLGRAS